MGQKSFLRQAPRQPRNWRAADYKYYVRISEIASFQGTLMNTITICYSTHRLETLELTTRIMADHDVIILEEPFHPDFSKMLAGEIDIDEHLLELDLGYPQFTLAQYKLLQQFAQNGKQILQVEPYLEHLIRLQYFFADGHSPAEVVPSTIEHAVYCAEREATGTLLDFYEKSRGKDFSRILSSMNAFAKTDGARFLLRDSLRAQKIMDIIVSGKNVYIEAGTIHLELCRLLIKKLRGTWNIKIHSVDQESIQLLHRRGNLYSPGDSLTVQYMWGRKMDQLKWELLCAQSLIYSIISEKEELHGAAGDFPHTLSDLNAIQSVKQLSLDDCKNLYRQIRDLPTSTALTKVQTHLCKDH